MSVLKRKILSRIGTIFGILAFLMLFVVPFKMPGTDNKLFAGIYFGIFLVCTAVANITLEKSGKPVTLDEEREEKIRQIFK